MSNHLYKVYYTGRKKLERDKCKDDTRERPTTTRSKTQRKLDTRCEYDLAQGQNESSQV